jgi:dihydrodipicolinate synthase/N-acetylneuraminate lyase
LIEYLLRIGVEGIFPGSSTGAFTLFTLKEHREIIEFSKEKHNIVHIFV